jgi:C4-dicarboxylate-specific signal transduction histidine kinase
MTLASSETLRMQCRATTEDTSVSTRNIPATTWIRLSDRAAGAITSFVASPSRTMARGLGLGLSLARAILEKHQGTLRTESEPGRGSTFTVGRTAPRQERSSL